MTSESTNDSEDDRRFAPSAPPSSSGEPPDAPPPPSEKRAERSRAEHQPLQINRYRINGLLGRGGQGSVYSAWDPKLNRTVAIKILHVPFDPRAELEAQTAASVEHQNVVRVHTVETYERRTALVMEYLPRGTLTTWAVEEKRTVDELISRFLEAGRGLAEIHARGLVHRDFKPDNVLLKESGVATVSDFGLTRIENEETSRSGTRRFQAPELINYGNASAASDQYAFCVSLYLLLTGEYPEPVYNGALKLPLGITVPAWLRVILARGLAASPSERFPSMLELLEALELNPEVRRRTLLRQLLVAAALGLIAVTSLILLLRETPDERALRVCGERADQLEAQLWSPRIVGRIQEHFTSVAGTSGTQTFERVRLRLEPEVKALVKASREACAIKNPLERVNTETCLKARGALLSTTGDFLASLDGSDVPGVLRTLSLEVKPVESCHSSQPLPTSLTANDADRALLVALAPVSLLRSAGRYEEARRLAVDVFHRAEDEHAPWAQAEALLYAGLTLADQHQSTAAGQLERAISAADAIGADELRARAWIALMGVHVAREEFPNASRAADNATAIVRRLGSPDLLAGPLLNAEGARLYQLGELADANEKFLAYHSVLLKTRDPNDAMVRHSENNVLLTSSTNRVEGFRALLAKTLAELGPEHPETLFTRGNYASMLLANGEGHEALTELSAVIRIRVTGPKYLRTTLDSDYLLRSRVLEFLARPEDAAIDSWVGLKLLREGSPPDGKLHRELEHRYELLTSVNERSLQDAVKENRLLHDPALLGAMPVGPAAINEIIKEICSLGLPSPDPKRPCPKTE